MVAIGVPGFSQSIQGTILGTARDQTGAVVPAVTVEVVNAGTNSSRTVTTDENGDYRVANLEPGRYGVTAVMPGFRRWARDEIALDANQIRRIDLELAIGDVNMTVTVVANATPL